MALTPEEEAAVQQSRANSYVSRTRQMLTQLLTQMQASDALLDEYTSGGFADDSFLPVDGVFAGGAVPTNGPSMFGANTDMTREEFRSCISSLQAVQGLLAQGHLTNLLKGRKG